MPKRTKKPPTDPLLQFTVSPDLKDLISKAADAKGVPMAGWLRMVAHDAAMTQLKQQAADRDALLAFNGLKS